VIWVVFALPFEGRGFPERGVGFEKKVLNVCGVAAARRFEDILYLSSSKPERVILAGLAGGLNPDLRVGDVLAQGEVLAGARRGVVFTADEIADTSEKKRELREKTGADCVDLETGPVAEVCQLNDIPFVSVRAISDTSAEDLPVPGNVLVHPVTMAPSTFGICRCLISRPWKIPAFFRMVRNSISARDQLVDFLWKFLAPAKAPRTRRALSGENFRNKGLSGHG
jgi:hypothetical protein